MMGPTHVATGAAAWLAGCAAATVLGSPPGVYQLVVGTALCAWGAMWPDIDHPSSSVAYSLGWPTRRLAEVVAWAGRRLHADTRLPADVRDLDGHRTITHTVLFAVLSLVGFGWLASSGQPWARVTTLVVIAWAAATALRALGVRGTSRAVLTGAVVFTAWWWPAPSGWWLGYAIGLGALVHSLGDRETNQGVPLAFPVKVRGQRWYRFRAARWRRFSTGRKGNREPFIRWLCLAWCGLTLPVMAYFRWPRFAELTHQVVAAVS